MRILVTGGAGYIGAVLVPRLLADGHRVTVLDNLMYGQTALLDCCADERLAVVRGDVRDSRLLDRLVSEHDVLLPLACITGAPACARVPDEAMAINRDAIRALVKLRSTDQMLVFPSTQSVYGVATVPGACDENTPMNPVSLYARLKAETEQELLDAGECVVLRFATLFGVSPRMRLDLLVNDFTYRAVTDRFVVLFQAHFKRNYLHVRDAAAAFVHSLAHYESMKGRPYNVGLSDANLSKLELCEAIRRHVPGFHFPIAEMAKDPDQRDYVVSHRRMEAAGFRATRSLDAGIAELVKACEILRRTPYANA